MTRYFYHAESGCAWPQQDDAPAPDDGLSTEIDAAEFEQFCKAEAEARYAQHCEHNVSSLLCPQCSSLR